MFKKIIEYFRTNPFWEGFWYGMTHPIENTKELFGMRKPEFWTGYDDGLNGIKPVRDNRVYMAGWNGGTEQRAYKNWHTEVEK